MDEWIQKHWANVITVGSLVIVAFIEAWQQAASTLLGNSHLPRLEGTWNFVPFVLLIIAGAVWLLGRKKTATRQGQQNSAMAAGIPTLSALLGQDSGMDFDAKKFFALAHYSPVTAEVEKNIKEVARQYSPNDKEAFYARFIGIGLVAYQHDISWFTIFGSQLMALAEMNSRGLIPLADLKKHYDKAVVDYPKTYANYSLEQWVDFMKSRSLIATYPSQMVELSWNGKDFLKYLAHTGRNMSEKGN